MEIIYQTIISGIISSLVVLYVNNRYNKKQEKLNVIAEVIGRSYQLVNGNSHEEMAFVLNKSYIIFHDKYEVVIALEKFKKSLGHEKTEVVNELYANIIKTMCRSIDISIEHFPDSSLLRPFL